MQERLYNLLLKLPKKNIINLMWDALDEMQAYNGRSRTYCIMKSLGAESDGEYSWKMPKVKDAKEHTENLGL